MDVLNGMLTDDRKINIIHHKTGYPVPVMRKVTMMMGPKVRHLGTRLYISANLLLSRYRDSSVYQVSICLPYHILVRYVTLHTAPFSMVQQTLMELLKIGGAIIKSQRDLGMSTKKAGFGPCNYEGINSSRTSSNSTKPFYQKLDMPYKRQGKDKRESPIMIQESHLIKI